MCRFPIIGLSICQSGSTAPGGKVGPGDDDVLDSIFIREHAVKWVIVGAQTQRLKLPRREWIDDILWFADHAKYGRIPVFLKNNLEPIIGEKLRQERQIAVSKVGPEGIREIILYKQVWQELKDWAKNTQSFSRERERRILVNVMSYLEERWKTNPKKRNDCG